MTREELVDLVETIISVQDKKLKNVVGGRTLCISSEI